MHLLAHSAGVHTCHTPDCMILVPVLLTWHSTLYNRHPLHTIATYDEPAKKKPKTLSGYFDLFDLCNPGHDTLHLFQGRRIIACPDRSKIIVLTLVVPRKSDTAHSFLRGPSSQPSAGRDGHLSSSLSAKNGWTPGHALDLNMKLHEGAELPLGLTMF
jgi:hypothetical protein